MAGTQHQTDNQSFRHAAAHQPRPLTPLRDRDRGNDRCSQHRQSEFDLKTGRRGDRDNLVEDLLCRLAGAEAATVVNNNAAAVFLVLNTLANRKRVAVSRCELVEIGDSFRMPDIIRKSGCRLLEIGTTNRTHLKDYRQALEDGAGLLLKVHTSNYCIEGFVYEVHLESLAQFGHENGVPVVADLGGGTLVDLTR